MSTFDAGNVALDLIDAVHPIAVLVDRRNKKLADQLRRAASSVVNNTCEGRRRTGGDRLHAFRVALAEAAETTASVETAIRWRYVDRALAEPALALADRMRAMLWRLANPRR